MEFPIHIVDAFASRRFTGNPAAVVLCDAYPAAELLQAIAAENNLAETAFPLPRNDGKWDLRWFTPSVEVPLCGHATLASAFVLFRHVIPEAAEIEFVTRSAGELVVRKEANGELVMDFPANPLTPCNADVSAIFARQPVGLHINDHFIMAVLGEADDVRRFVPDRAAILTLPRNLIITAPGDGDYDCVSRFFAPANAIDEDPVTGAAHCVIAPYWADKLRKNDIRAWQASPRGGQVLCRVLGDRVQLRGRCVPYLSGRIELD